MPKNWLKPDWPAPANVHAATTLRSDGFSCGVYDSFNLALHVEDDRYHVQQNREQLIQQLALPAAPIWLEQIHGDRVIQADQVSGIPAADASFTRVPNVVCAILTADCLPVIFCSPDGQTVAAAHAGWRGLLAGVLSNTVTAMQASNIMAWLGPAIGPNCFEVGTEVHAAFIQKNPQFAVAFKAVDANHFLADIYQLAKIELTENGIKTIYGGDFCTVSDQQRFFSYRRDKQTGRMATVIWRD